MLSRALLVMAIIGALLGSGGMTGIAAAQTGYEQCVNQILAFLAKNPHRVGEVTVEGSCHRPDDADTPSGSSTGNSGKSSSGKAAGPTRDEIIAMNAAIKKRNEARAAEHKRKTESYNGCVPDAPMIPGVDGARSTCGLPPSAPDFESMKDVPGMPKDAAPEEFGLPSVTIGYVASTKLQLPATSIRIGPDPSWNEWDKAFVGYPYWLWVDSPTKPMSSSQSVGPIKVGLSARLAKVTFAVDGEDPVVCQGPGTPYVRTSNSVPKKSPDCGIRFATKGEKTIVATATWEVQWTVNGQQGTVTMAQVGRRPVVVSELHSVNVDPPR